MSGTNLVVENETPMVEVAEAPVVEEKVSEIDLKEAGFTPHEIEVAKKEGMIAEPKAEDKSRGEGADDKPEKPKTPAHEDAELPQDERPAPVDGELDPENEKEMLSKYNRNEQALYFQNKRNKVKRQRAEAERDQMTLRYNQTAKKIEELASRIEAITAKPEAEQSEFADLLEEGEKPKKVEKKYLTREDLELIEKEKAEKIKAADENKSAAAKVIHSKIGELSLDARARYSDFEETLGYANEIVEKTVSGRLAEIIPDVKTQRKIDVMVRDFLGKLGGLDEDGKPIILGFSEDDYNPADLGYEIGQLHPSYGKNGKSSANANNGNKSREFTPVELERMERNANKRQTSAGIGGGAGRRLVSLDDITLEQALNLPPEQYAKLPAKTRERLLRE